MVLMQKMVYDVVVNECNREQIECDDKNLFKMFVIKEGEDNSESEYTRSDEIKREDDIKRKE